MCGIVGCAGARQASPVLLNGLKKLEYRGYDSAGMAVADENGRITAVKAKGRLTNLAQLTNEGKALSGFVGIGHTRWATHGEPNDVNSHPHLSKGGRFAVVHNGIIENYLELKAFLNTKGYDFKSETDTEAIAHLLDYYYAGDMLDCIRKTTNKLNGSYALGVLFSETPDVFYAVRKDSPLVVGLGKNENFIASDMPALLEYTKNFVLLGEGEIAVVSKNKVLFYDVNLEPAEKESFTVDWDPQTAEKGGYPHFMIKEIHEQPNALRNTLSPRIQGEKIVLDKIRLTADDVKKIRKINIIGCGSAYHAGIIGKYYIEQICRIPVETDLASEFRYRNPIINEGALTVIISQSGETADTLAALREAKRLKSRVLAIVNVVGSSIAREADDVLYTYAGPEIAVATTKGYTSQIAALYLIGLFMASCLGTLPKEEYLRQLDVLKSLPDLTEQILATPDKTQYLSSLYCGCKDAFFIGRGMDYASALEGALKLKEITYIHAEAYPAGELKHGTISLIENGSLVLAVAVDKRLFEKTLSGIKEVKTRGAVVVAIASPEGSKIENVADHTLYIPDCPAVMAPVLTAVYLQLFGYYAAAARGLDIDKPRNLAKSVTVE